MNTLRKPTMGKIWCPFFEHMLPIQDCREANCPSLKKDLGSAGIMCDYEDTDGGGDGD